VRVRRTCARTAATKPPAAAVERAEAQHKQTNKLIIGAGWPPVRSLGGVSGRPRRRSDSSVRARGSGGAAHVMCAALVVRLGADRIGSTLCASYVPKTSVSFCIRVRGPVATHKHNQASTHTHTRARTHAHTRCAVSDHMARRSAEKADAFRVVGELARLPPRVPQHLTPNRVTLVARGLDGRPPRMAAYAGRSHMHQMSTAHGGSVVTATADWLGRAQPAPSAPPRETRAVAFNRARAGRRRATLFGPDPKRKLRHGAADGRVGRTSLRVLRALVCRTWRVPCSCRSATASRSHTPCTAFQGLRPTHHTGPFPLRPVPTWLCRTSRPV
jgi:hypothetical protein